MCVKESLHPWDKPHLIMVYDPFNVLLDSVFASILLRMVVHQRYWPIIFFVCGIFSIDIRVMMAS